VKLRFKCGTPIWGQVSHPPQHAWGIVFPRGRALEQVVSQSIQSCAQGSDPCLGEEITVGAKDKASGNGPIIFFDVLSVYSGVHQADKARIEQEPDMMEHFCRRLAEFIRDLLVRSLPCKEYVNDAKAEWIREGLDLTRAPQLSICVRLWKWHSYSSPHLA
jgi:hypothetical protein